VRVLITGGTGFLGSFTAHRRVAAGDQVWVTRFDGVSGAHYDTPGAAVIPCDVNVPEQMEQAIAESKPDVVFHYAAQTFIGESWSDPGYTFRTNTVGTANLLEILHKRGDNPVVVIACSSAEYGEIAARGTPVKETDDLLPLSPYGLSKLDQDLLGFLYFRTYGMRVIRARIFNTIGPGKQGDFMADFCQQIVAMERGANPVLRTGNLNSLRDLNDVHDTVAGLDLLARHGVAGEPYNICSGKTLRIADVVKVLVRTASREITLEQESARLRPYEENIIWGDNRKLIEATGWAPTVALQQTVSDTLEFWRQRAAARPVDPA
jgi:GDP-4-dehydro-6-deoxy-D-mannose reductase